MKKIMLLMLVCAVLFGCSGAEDLSSTQEAVCGSHPTPNGTIATYIPPQVPNKGNYIDSLSGNSTGIDGHTNNGNSGHVDLGTNSRFTCTGSWTYSAARGPITGVAASTYAGGGRLALTDLLGTTNIDCASTDGGAFSNMTWTGLRLQTIKGLYASGVGTMEFGGSGGVTQSTTVTNSCP